ncbi:MAG: uroporphyrinogen-III C-methyltransferase [Coriobacteriia bacterium]|nr:uroporphyrinogen-III C-methyltransferase [Coriobacteriia bacterium]
MDLSNTNINPSPLSTPQVYLVGAGPGDAELLTLKALHAIEQADTIIYDTLIPADILRHARPGCELIFVGKSPGRHYRLQEEINALLIEKATSPTLAAGDPAAPTLAASAPAAPTPSADDPTAAATPNRTIVRLKGGDPFVFGRGGEEALALAQHGISFEVIPGVSSAFAVPAYAGIPVTHRGLASSLTIITGHEDPQKLASSIAWGQLAKTPGTLVVLMGMANLPLIADRLLAHGKAPQTPAAIIEHGATPRQRTVRGDLSTIAALATRHKLTNPAVIVIGEVVELNDKIGWFESRPLFGQRIVVTRARQQASRLSSALRNLGADVFEQPTIAFDTPSDPQQLRAALAQIETFSHLIFTSVNGVEAFFAELLAQAVDLRRLAGIQLVAIGPVTQKALQDRGLQDIIVPQEYVAESIVDMLRGQAGPGQTGTGPGQLSPGQLSPGQQVLLVRAEKARDALPRLLAEFGVTVTEVAGYQTRCADADTQALVDALRAGAYHGVTFTSSSTVHNLIKMLSGDTNLLQGIDLYSIGPITSDTLREYQLTPTAEATTFTVDGLVAAIVTHATERKGSR